jgi:hypothetical protein
MAKIKILEFTSELVGEDDKLLQTLKRMGVKVKNRKSEESKKTAGTSDEKIIKRDAEKEVVEEWVKPKLVKGELKLLQKSVKEETEPVTYCVIDGSNVCRCQNSRPSVAVLLSLTLELCKRSWGFISLFDASIRSTLSVRDLFVYRQLQRSYPDFFSEITGGIEADKFILLYADKLNASVISNDLYRKYQKDYEWLTSNPERLIKFHVMARNLTIPEWSMILAVNRNSSDLLEEMSVVIKNLNPLTNIKAAIR